MAPRIIVPDAVRICLVLATALLVLRYMCICSRREKSVINAHETALGTDKFPASVLQHKESNTLPRLIGEDLQNSEFQVPNIVHYIWYSDKPTLLQFHQMVGILSADKILDPDAIYFHTNIEPIGPHWERVKRLPKVQIKNRRPSTHVYGEKLTDQYYVTDRSDVDRILVLMEHGGIYLDFDVLVTQSFDDLRRHVCTVGLEGDTQACGSIIVCSKKAFVLYLWINSYLDDYRVKEWAYNTGMVPFNLAKRYPHLLHVEANKLNRPNFHELDQIWGPSSFDWRNNYAVHTWYRLWKLKSPHYKGVEPDEANIKTWNSTFGEMARSVLFGKADLMQDKD